MKPAYFITNQCVIDQSIFDFTMNMEKRIGELKYGLAVDDFWADDF